MDTLYVQYVLDTPIQSVSATRRVVLGKARHVLDTHCLGKVSVRVPSYLLGV